MVRSAGSASSHPTISQHIGQVIDHLTSWVFTPDSGSLMSCLFDDNQPTALALHATAADPVCALILAMWKNRIVSDWPLSP